MVSMIKKIAMIMILFSLKVYSIPVSIEGGYFNGTNERSYDGWYLESSFPVYNFSETFYFSLDPFIHFIDTDFDPGFMMSLKKEFPLDHRWNLLIFGGLGVMYMNTDDVSQHDNFNFKENIGVGLGYTLSETTEIILKGSVWHISNGGITDHNSGINGNSVGVALNRVF